MKYKHLLEGLEAVEIGFLTTKIKGKELMRLEAEYFQSKYLAIEHLFKDKKSIGHYSKQIVCGPFGSNLLDTLYGQSGILVVRPFNLKNGKIESDNLVYVKEKDIEENRLKLFKRNTLLFSRVGDIKLGIQTVEQATISPNIIAVEFHDENRAKAFLFFFQTDYGFLQIDRELKIAAQPTISTNIISNLRVPEFSQRLIKTLASIFDRTIELEKQSQSFYTEAEHILLEELGIVNWQHTVKNNNTKTLKESFLASGRIDAEYYQPKYDDLQSVLYITGQAVNLGAHLHLNKRGTQPTYTGDESGVIVLNSKHIRENRIDFTDNRFGNPLETSQELIIRKYDVLINGTGVGTIGRTAVYTNDEPALPDNHVTILRPKDIDPLFLSVQLNSIIGKLQVDKYFRGSSGQIELYPADINNFIIWKAPENIQTKIRSTVEESEKLRIEAIKLQEAAKKAVEMAIEQDEQTALNYLKTVGNA